MTEIDRGRLSEVLRAEEERFVATHRRSGELFEEAKGSLLAGVPMPWMTEWAGPHPVFAASAEGAHFTDVDGNEYVDFCLGDTGAMTGHAPAATVAAIAEQARRGDHADAADRGLRLGRRRRWRAASACPTGSSRSPPPTPTGSRSASRGRSPAGRRSSSTPGATTAPSTRPSRSRSTAATASRPDNIGPPVDPGVTTVAVEWNDVDGAGGGAGERRGRLRAGRAGDDEHRDRPPRARLPRRAARADPRARHAAGDRRDAHDLRRARRLHGGLRPRAGLRSRSASRSPPGFRPPPTG